MADKKRSKTSNAEIVAEKVFLVTLNESLGSPKLRQVSDDC